MLGGNVRKLKALTMKMEKVHEVYEMNSTIFFLGNFYFWVIILGLDKYLFSWQMCFIWRVLLD